MKDAILSALRAIEDEHQVRVLLAVESGSRAWGFASPDSDFDVRFIYVHRPAWYLSVFEPRDVIEQMLPGDLDASGWELRKSLRLFSKCNLALNEWLGSPVVYHEVPAFRDELCALIPAYFHPLRATHHYRSMAQQALSHLAANHTISIKKLLYATRALLACRWIRQHASQPPTEFHRIVEQVAGPDERAWVADLLERKRETAEKVPVALDPGLGQAMLSELEAATRDVPPGDACPKPSPATLDTVLRRWIDSAPSRPLQRGGRL